MALNDVQHVLFHILAGHKPGIVVAAARMTFFLQAADMQSFALAKGVIHQTIVLTEYFAIVKATNFTFFRWQIAGKKLLEGPLADKTNSCRILFRCDMQTFHLSDFAHLALVNICQREECF